MQENEYLVYENDEIAIKQEYLDKLKKLKETKERVERELKALSNAITKELSTKFSETTKVSGYNYTIKGGYYDLEFDMDTFKSENIETYIKYLKPHFVKETSVLVSASRKREQ